MKNYENETKAGIIYGLSAFILWGLFPIYFKQLHELGFAEIVAHRIIWSVLFLYILLKFSKKLSEAKRFFTNKKTAFLLFISGVLIALNWSIYIYAVSIDKIVDASLGYFINPLITMLLGVIILKEQISNTGKFAIFIVFIAISIQIYDVGGLPFISVVLPLSFAIYSLVRKRIKIPSLEGLFVETTMVMPIAIAALFFIAKSGQNHFDFSWFGLFITLCGPLTVIPLLLFNSAALRINLSTIGYMQYISPSLQLLIAVFAYNEPINTAKISSFVLIWIALGVVSIDGIYKKKKQI
ncbi:EamA family transporter RarD [Campylobacter sp. RM16187]|uniref:EamA family transporter RarD n=1 Tax=Campylobacter sp. RM16187 TaxID=1660063 RepID=UPI0021B601E1|nr:EamA family transporter RarD [Campylobacter sp. RM16187]QKG29428.1 resistance permease RarD [Campylobacter sp. RM16187]